MKSVFVVDDEPFIHVLYREILERGGYEVLEGAHDGVEALEMLRSMNKRPDIIVMDHRMPRRDGVETTIKILEETPEARVLFASADPSIERRALKAGAAGFLVKPFHIGELLESLKGI